MNRIFAPMVEPTAFVMRHIDGLLGDHESTLGMSFDEQDSCAELMRLYARTVATLTKFADLPPDLIEMAGTYLTGQPMRSRRARKTNVCTTAKMNHMQRAFVECNPGFVSMEMISRILRAPGKIVRSPQLTIDRRSSWPDPEHTRKSFPEPRDPDTRVYYCDTPEGQHLERNRGKPAYRHAHSPLYMFHSWAWGRQNYARILQTNNLDACPYTGLRVDVLLNRNGEVAVWPMPEADHSHPGVRYLHDDLPGIRLAVGWMAEKLGRGLSDRLRPIQNVQQYLPVAGSIGYTALFVPAYGKRAHTIPEFQNEAVTAISPTAERAVGRPFSGKASQMGTTPAMLRLFILRAMKECGIAYPKTYLTDLLRTHKIMANTMYHRTIRPQHDANPTLWSSPVLAVPENDSEHDSDTHEGTTMEAATTDEFLADMVDVTKSEAKLEADHVPDNMIDDAYDVAYEALMTKIRTIDETYAKAVIHPDLLLTVEARVKQTKLALFAAFEAEWPQ